MICVSAGSKSRLAKAAGGLLRTDKKNCTPLWREADFKPKYTKRPAFGALLEVVMSKNGTLLWREAHLQVKILKN